MASKKSTKKNAKKEAAPAEVVETTEAVEATQEKEVSLEEQLRDKLNIKTDYEALPADTDRKSSFSDGVAAYKRGNRYYTQEEYERTNARRQKLEARLVKQMNRATEEAEKATAA